jgi:hypothetical protein
MPMLLHFIEFATDSHHNRFVSRKITLTNQ